jgi:hypothetical protein
MSMAGPLSLYAETEGSREVPREAPANAISSDPLWMLFNIYKLCYERKVADQFSAALEVIYSPDFLWGLHEYSTLTYLDVTAKGRYYFGSLLKDSAEDVDIEGYQKYIGRLFTDALGGLYVGAFGGYVNSIVEKGEDASFFNATFNGYGGGLELGCKYIFGTRRVSFFAEPYVLLRYYTGSYRYKDSAGNSIEKPSGFADGFDRNGFSGGINFGIVF